MKSFLALTLSVLLFASTLGADESTEHVVVNENVLYSLALGFFEQGTIGVVLCGVVEFLTRLRVVAQVAPRS